MDDSELEVMIYEWNYFFRDYVMIFWRKSLFFSLMKRTKNQGFGIDVKAQISIFTKDSRSERFIVLTPEMLILSVICCAASSKSLAFQFAIKTNNPKAKWMILNWKFWFMNEINSSWFWNDLFWNEIFVLLLDQKKQKLRLRDCC